MRCNKKETILTSPKLIPYVRARVSTPNSQLLIRNVHPSMRIPKQMSPLEANDPTPSVLYGESFLFCYKIRTGVPTEMSETSNDRGY